MEKVIVIVGPTGVGKTKLSVDIAKLYNGEIISGDAYQIYKEMNIGTAKVKPEQTQGVPHYLVDELSYHEEYNVKLFQEKGRAYIQKILDKGKVPIICGGTGLYIKALLYDYLFCEEKIDQTYFDYLQTLTSERLYEMLIKQDEKACETIHPNNRKRVIRALMMAHSGEKKSERLKQQEHTLLYDAYIIGLTMDRDHLYERINTRVDEMMNNYLYEEVKQLVNTPQDFMKQSMRAIGYKEWEECFFEQKSKEDTCELIKKNSRNFAKRQYTWFNNQMDVNWYDVSLQDTSISILQDCQTFLEGEANHD